ncbi:hypothetical protein FCM35_KLT04908 [Carex littledalei]|uniref:Uncharacterized protein n=1 Tax=Carex littledalei TaxID=544730 RepID=A0A833V999_9POAL|nr:hypothetical protein FCM35_KLT04908 [Carex littledalei]
MGSFKSSSHLFPSSSKKTCLCAPTTHPGSFRCKLHRGTGTKSVRHVAAYSGEVSLKGNANLKTNMKARTMNDLLRKKIKPSKSDSDLPGKEFQPTISRFGEINSDGTDNNMITVP